MDICFWILGLIRDIVITGLLGAGVALDTFVVVMKMPSVFRRLFAEGAFNQAFIPVLAEYKEGNIGEVKNLLITPLEPCQCLLIFTVLAFLFAPFFVMLFAQVFISSL